VDIDTAAVAALRGLPQVVESARAHADEHALEVRCRFCSPPWAQFTLVPLVVGDATAPRWPSVLERLWGGEETLVVVSSDLSHYLPMAKHRSAIRATVDAMLRLDHSLDPSQACGAIPVNGLLLAARRRGMTPTLLDLRNSGDTAGDRSRVVGYASLALYERPTARPHVDGATRTATPERGRCCSPTPAAPSPRRWACPWLPPAMRSSCRGPAPPS